MDGDAFTMEQKKYPRRHSFNLAGLGTSSQKPGFSIASADMFLPSHLENEDLKFLLSTLVIQFLTVDLDKPNYR